MADVNAVITENQTLMEDNLDDAQEIEKCHFIRPIRRICLEREFAWDKVDTFKVTRRTYPVIISKNCLALDTCKIASTHHYP